MIKVFLADDHAIIRDGLKVFLELNPDIQVVGEATNGCDAVDQVCELQPDVIVMDISMPGMNGIDATREIGCLCPSARVIILSMLGTPEYVFQALQAGAQGYLLKESASREVVEAVLTVHAGRRYLSEPITSVLVTDYLQKSEEIQEKSPVGSLSQQEQKILVYVVEGKTSPEIAEILFLSPKTVETYRSRLMQKLGVKDLAGLIKFAIKNKLIGLE